MCARPYENGGTAKDWRKIRSRRFANPVTRSAPCTNAAAKISVPWRATLEDMFSISSLLPWGEGWNQNYSLLPWGEGGRRRRPDEGVLRPSSPASCERKDHA